MIKTFKEFVDDYNDYYQTNFNVVRVNSLELPEVMYYLYDTEDFEIDYDKKIIELY
ncbi:hypothetical protein [uncultured Clostridium sp.]|uniref:hypothetical protein n=1 Tax=uncultured Clostridium sp. TaxID=59620 RepID=UPI00260C5323|nr:hypothetical protein [uncultured Clostridium sp.]